MSATVSFATERPITDRDELVLPFLQAHKAQSQFRIGAESEKFGWLLPERAPLPYQGPRSIQTLFQRLAARDDWREVREFAGGPVISLTRGAQAVTLEPGGQVELSGAPLDDVHALASEQSSHLALLAPLAQELGVVWLSLGFHPFCSGAELPWVPKQRYPIMQRYLPECGRGALDMMQRTATTQLNFDFSDEADAIAKLRVLLRWSPIVHAMTANAPFIEGQRAPQKSVRGQVWLNMDPSRSGLIPPLWRERAGYRDYVEWALDAGMFLIRRGEQVIRNTGQTFRSFLRDGFAGHRPTLTDWKAHLATLFPEVRLKSTIEVRCADAQSPPIAAALWALLVGIVYDRTALEQAHELAARFQLDEVALLRPRLVAEGLVGALGGVAVRELAERLLDIASAGLRRRARRDARNQDESVYLTPLHQLVERGMCPADLLLAGARDELEPDAILERCTLRPSSGLNAA